MVPRKRESSISFGPSLCQAWYKPGHLPGTSSVCLSLRIPSVDFERYEALSSTFCPSVDLPPKKRLQRAPVCCGGAFRPLGSAVAAPDAPSVDSMLNRGSEYTSDLGRNVDAFKPLAKTPTASPQGKRDTHSI